MKQIVIILTFFFACFTPSSAQRLNKEGKKMVASIEILSYGNSKGFLRGKENITYTYNGDRTLKSVSSVRLSGVGGVDIRKDKDKDINEVSIVRSGNTLKKTERYNGKIHPEHSFSVKFDGRYITEESTKYINGLIITDRIQVENGKVVKGFRQWGESNETDESTYEYVDDNLVMVHGLTLITHKRTCKVDTFKIERPLYSVYTDHVNDTNVNLLYFQGCDHWPLTGGGSCVELEMSTEWYPFRSHNLLKSINRRPTMFDYTFDDNGNLVKMEITSVYNADSGAKTVITINYVQ